MNAKLQLKTTNRWLSCYQWKLSCELCVQLEQMSLLGDRECKVSSGCLHHTDHHQHTLAVCDPRAKTKSNKQVSVAKQK